jgi:hypothetical protein
MSQPKWFTSIFLEFNGKMLLIQKNELLLLPQCRVSFYSRIIDSLALNTEIQTGVAVENPDLIGIYLHLLPQEELEYHFLFYQKLTDWDVVKLKLRSDQLPHIRFLDSNELREWLKGEKSNLLTAQLNHYFSLDSNKLEYHIVRN